MPKEAAGRRRGGHERQQRLQTEIAIVDDDSALRRSLAFLLESCSYRVRTYASAREFLDAKRAQVSSCLILDLQMKQMTGAMLQSYLALVGMKIPVIILTGHGEAWVRDHCLREGAAAFLVKPVKPDQLLMTIAMVLGKNRKRCHKVAA